jgi:hypothetical protein
MAITCSDECDPSLQRDIHLQLPSDLQGGASMQLADNAQGSLTSTQTVEQLKEREGNQQLAAHAAKQPGFSSQSDLHFASINQTLWEKYTSNVKGGRTMRKEKRLKQERRQKTSQGDGRQQFRRIPYPSPRFWH